MNRMELKGAFGINFNVLAKMARNDFVSTESLRKIYYAMDDCNIGDVMEFTNHETA